jgi:hypothetical protein
MGHLWWRMAALQLFGIASYSGVAARRAWMCRGSLALQQHKRTLLAAQLIFLG